MTVLSVESKTNKERKFENIADEFAFIKARKVRL